MWDYKDFTSFAQGLSESGLVHEMDYILTLRKPLTARDEAKYAILNKEWESLYQGLPRQFEY